MKQSADFQASSRPLETWDLNSLMLAAYFFNPDLDVARANVASAEAAIRTAAMKPNPLVSVGPGYESDPTAPFIMGFNFDLPIETAGKRGYADSTHSSAHLISVLPQLDPRLQAPSLLYSVAAHPGLIPGISVAVFLPSGPERNGWLVPRSAVVWWQGKAWCYVEESPGKFTRRTVATSNPIPNGWFVTEGIDPDARVVTVGAQTLFSEEFRSQIQADQD
jgi:hypothetical protein